MGRPKIRKLGSDAILALYRDGEPIAWIASLAGITRQAVNDIRRQAAEPRRAGGFLRSPKHPIASYGREDDRGGEGKLDCPQTEKTEAQAS